MDSREWISDSIEQDRPQQHQEWRAERYNHKHQLHACPAEIACQARRRPALEIMHHQSIEDQNTFDPTQCNAFINRKKLFIYRQNIGGETCENIDFYDLISRARCGQREFDGTA